MNLPTPTFLSVTLALFAFACSDPPSPPAQGAVEESIGSVMGGACQATTGAFTAPVAGDPNSGTFASLTCDASKSGCKPDNNVVVDGDNGSQVSCTVSGDGTAFNVEANLAQGDVAFSVQGSFGPSGGTGFLSSNHAQHGLQDDKCNIVIQPNHGEIKAGAIWAAFQCDNFKDISTGQVGCGATGAFIFENCSK